MFSCFVSPVTECVSINKEAIYCPGLWLVPLYVYVLFPSGRFNTHLRALGSISHSTRFLGGGWVWRRRFAASPLASEALMCLSQPIRKRIWLEILCEEASAVHKRTHTCWQDRSETVTFVLLNPSMCQCGSLWSFDDDQSRGKVCS